MRAALLSYSNEIGNHPPSSQTFCLVCFPPLQRSGCKPTPRPGATSRDKPEWLGVRYIRLSSTGFGCVSIGSGMSEADHGRG